MFINTKDVSPTSPFTRKTRNSLLLIQCFKGWPPQKDMPTLFAGLCVQLYSHKTLGKKVSIKVYQLQFPQGAKKANSNYDVITTIAKRFASIKRHSIVRFSCRAGELHEDRSAESV